MSIAGGPMGNRFYSSGIGTGYIKYLQNWECVYLSLKHRAWFITTCLLMKVTDED